MLARTEFQEPFFRNDSSSTICSLDAEELVNQRLRENQIETQVPTQSGPKVGNVCIDGSKTIQVGDQITYYIYPQKGYVLHFFIKILKLIVLCLNRCQCSGT